MKIWCKKILYDIYSSWLKEGSLRSGNFCKKSGENQPKEPLIIPNSESYKNQADAKELCGVEGGPFWVKILGPISISENGSHKPKVKVKCKIFEKCKTLFLEVGFRFDCYKSGIH